MNKRKQIVAIGSKGIVASNKKPLMIIRASEFENPYITITSQEIQQLDWDPNLFVGSRRVGKTHGVKAVDIPEKKLNCICYRQSKKHKCPIH